MQYNVDFNKHYIEYQTAHKKKKKSLAPTTRYKRNYLGFNDGKKKPLTSAYGILYNVWKYRLSN